MSKSKKNKSVEKEEKLNNEDIKDIGDLFEKEEKTEEIEEEKKEEVKNKLQNDISMFYNNDDTKHSFKGVIGFLIFILILGIIFFVFKFLILTPKNIVSYKINKLYDSFINNISKISYGKDYEIDYDIAWNIKTPEENEIIKKINDLKMNLFYVKDEENKKIDLKANLISKNNDMLNLSLYLRDNDVYLKSDDLYDKFVYSNIENEINTKEYISSCKSVVKIIKDKLLDNIKNSNFTSEKATLELSNNKVDVTKITYTLKKKELEELYNLIVSDKEFAKNLSVMLLMEEEQIDNVINSLKQEISSIDANEEYYISLYTKGLLNKLVGIETSAKVSKDNFKFIIDNDVYTVNINISSKNNEIVIKKQGDSYTIDGNLFDTNIDSLITVKDNINVFNIDLINGDDKYSLNFAQTKNDDKNGKFTITTSFTSNNELFEIKLDFDYNIKYSADFENINFDNKIRLENLSEEELNNILNNFINSSLIKNLKSENIEEDTKEENIEEDIVEEIEE